MWSSAGPEFSRYSIWFDLAYLPCWRESPRYFSTFPRSWNKFIKNLKVTRPSAAPSAKTSDMPGVGDQLAVTIEPNGDKSSQQFDPVVLESSSTMLRWQGVLCCSCCFAAEHYFVANEHEKDEPGTKFTHGERFSGCLLCPG